MPRVLLLTALPTPDPDETAARVAPLLRERGHGVRISCIDDLGLDAEGPCLTGGPALRREHDLLWVLGFGRAATFLDKMQLLAAAGVPLVNGVEALLLLHGKYPPPALAPFMPETHASTRSEALVDHACRAGGRWVLKPPAGSFGRGVTIGEGRDPAFVAAARALTRGDRYALLQRHVAGEEHRVLVADGEIVGAYARIGPGTGDGAANLALGGDARPARTDALRDARAREIASVLTPFGVRFAGLDLVGDTLLEANIVNPGGLGTLARLGDPDATARLVAALFA